MLYDADCTKEIRVSPRETICMKATVHDIFLPDVQLFLKSKSFLIVLMQEASISQANASKHIRWKSRSQRTNPKNSRTIHSFYAFCGSKNAPQMTIFGSLKLLRCDENNNANKRLGGIKFSWLFDDIFGTFLISMV